VQIRIEDDNPVLNAFCGRVLAVSVGSLAFLLVAHFIRRALHLDEPAAHGLVEAC
jgi:hypothetical protein